MCFITVYGPTNFSQTLQYQIPLKSIQLSSVISCTKTGQVIFNRQGSECTWEVVWKLSIGNKNQQHQKDEQIATIKSTV
jgi:hypothetical protein